MKIALVAKKGGVGKTTLCLLLHEAFKRAERTVAVRDYDAQVSRVAQNYCLSSLIRNTFVQYAYRLAPPATITGGTEDEWRPGTGDAPWSDWRIS